jgi:flavin reductase (DIM6/NTAB) family NADH-FMN oxidoreductase RutF
MPGRQGPAPDLAEALASWATAVTLLTVADDRDDVGATVSAFCPVSADPPLVLVSLMSGSYPAELFGRAEEPVTRFAVTLLAEGRKEGERRFAAAR